MSAAALVVLALASAQTDQARVGNAAALRQAKLETWPGLYRTQNAAGLAAFLADDFVAVSADGSVEKKAEAVAWVRANAWQNVNNNFRYDITDIAFYGPDTANVYGVGSFDGRGATGECRIRYSSANIFVRQAGRWRPRFSHTSSPTCSGER